MEEECLIAPGESAALGGVQPYPYCIVVDASLLPSKQASWVVLGAHRSRDRVERASGGSDPSPFVFAFQLPTPPPSALASTSSIHTPAPAWACGPSQLEGDPQCHPQNSPSPDLHQTGRTSCPAPPTWPPSWVELQYSLPARSSVPATMPATDQSQSEVGARRSPPRTRRRLRVERGRSGGEAAGAAAAGWAGPARRERVASWWAAVAASPQTRREARCLVQDL